MTPVTCVITDRHRDEAGGLDALVRRVAWAARAGAHIIQVRERDLDGRPLADLVRRCLDAARGTGARVVVNDRLDVALACGAHGVHLRADSMPAARVRAIAPARFLVGRSVHGADEAARVEREGGLDYLVFGTVFPSTSKPRAAPAGTSVLRQTVQSVRLPVLAVGGITPDNLREVAAAGAAGFAAIGLFVSPSDADTAAALTDAAAAWAAPR